ncbi:MAG: antitoxin Xre-like helix-turn-helix domain-containing protein [Geminicoccaceae bacterium]
MTPPALELSKTIDRRSISGPLLRMFFRVAHSWRLSNDEQMCLLGLTAPSTFFKWKKEMDVALPRDTIERITYVINIYGSLEKLFRDEEVRHRWVREDNSAIVFNGRSALAKMLSGHVRDLFLVQRYLNQQTSGAV